MFRSKQDKPTQVVTMISHSAGIKPRVFKKATSLIAILVGTLAFSFLINTFVIQSYEVDGFSMSPTLNSGNRLIIWKFPKTIAKVTRHAYIPKRGEIVVFYKPAPFDEQLIKRVVGLPGERVVISNGTITIFNYDHPNGFNPDKLRSFTNVLSPTYGDVDTVVEKDHIFVCGDNRIKGASLDSRSGLGTIDIKDIVGKLTLRLFPLSKIFKF